MIPMPIEWVDRIFAKLSIRYGREFTGKWEGIDPDDVKADWANALSGFVPQPDAVIYALTHLPERAPNVQEFSALCRRAPNKNEPKKIDGPAPDMKRVQETVNAVNRRSEERDPIDWAKRPKSLMAFNALVDLAKKEHRFAEVVRELTEAGHVVNGALVNRWDGAAWARI